MGDSQPKLPVSQLTHGLPETAGVIGVAVLSIILAAHFQLTESLYALTRHWEYFQIDELPIGLLVLAIGLIWLSSRRYRQAGRQLKARQLAEARLAGVLAENRKLAQEYLRVQEFERKYMARELHDELGQYLNAIKLDAVAIKESRGSDTQMAMSSSLSIIRSVDHVHAAVSDMIRRLRPAGLDELGLAAAIENCLDHWRQRLPDTRFSLTIRGDFQGLHESLTLSVYRLIQEGLTNIYKHAGARQVDITVERRESPRGGADQLVLTVVDDGRGMELHAPTSGFGLSGMRERVEMIGGTFLLESEPGRGTSFAATLPVQGE
jgi:two-component system, NarL family, sensor histidine kinase UhpB